MTDTVKLIVEISKEDLKRISDGEWIGTYTYNNMILNATPLDTVKSKIETDLSWDMFDEYGNETALHKELWEILDNIDKAESEDK